MKRSIALMFAVLMSTGYAAAADHPDSVNQPPRDGCNRSDLVYLGEAAVALEHEGGPNAAPEWVYVNDPGKPGEIRTIRTVEGSVVAIHTAGQDLFGNHRTYDLNIDLVELDPKHPDPAFERLVSSRNARETPPQIHTEWESGLVPLWVWPSPRDRVRETGSWIWDCGHWQEGSRSIPNSDLLPGDPLGTAGVEHIGGEEAEIHPISELATWRSPRAFVPSGRRRAVPVSQLDVYISNQGGGAKSVIECAIAPAAPANAAERAATETGCTQLQDVTGKDYVYDVVAPPRPSRGAKLRWRQVSHGSHHAPAAEVKVLRDRIRVTVPFKSSHAAAATALQDFGASYYVWWEGDHSPTYRFRVSLVQLTIFNNLDGDAGQSRSNPTITPNGEWNLYLDITGKWRALHQEMKAAGAGDLDNIPTKDMRHPYDLSRLASSEVDLTDGGSFRMFTDARDCDLPEFTDCPAGNELDFSQHPGRAELVVPVGKLIGKTTRFSIHPVPCGASCDEDHSDPACNPTWCYALTFTVRDVSR